MSMQIKEGDIILNKKETIETVFVATLGLVALLVGLYIFFQDKTSTDTKKFQVIQDSNIMALTKPDNVDLYVYCKENDFPPMIRENIIVADTKKDMALFSINDTYYDCRYEFSNNSWHIRISDMEKCSKEKAISEINSLVLKINNYFKIKADNKASWETKD